MNLNNNKNGAMGGKTLLVLIAVMVLVMAYLSGLITIGWPGTSLTDQYSETVNRNAADVGIRVPIEVKLTMTQDASSSTNTADLDASIKHKHEALGTDNNYVPDATLVDDTNFDSKVGNVDDTTTIYCVNGNSFQASNVTYNSSLTSLASVNYGNAQDNYKVWTTSTTHTPPTTPGTTSDDNSGILVQTVWTHYRKGTNEVMSRDTITWMIYYKMADYNDDESYTATYTYYVYVPFNDYALVEDIEVDIFGFSSHCDIEWTSVETVTHTFWDYPIINALFGDYFDSDATGQFKFVWSTDTVLATRIQYSWDTPLDRFNTDNDDQYGSHAYTYKVR